jgi:hypothetical protein
MRLKDFTGLWDDQPNSDEEELSAVKINWNGQNLKLYQKTVDKEEEIVKW